MLYLFYLEDTTFCSTKYTIHATSMVQYPIVLYHTSTNSTKHDLHTIVRQKRTLHTLAYILREMRTGSHLITLLLNFFCISCCYFLKIGIFSKIGYFSKNSLFLKNRLFLENSLFLKIGYSLKIAYYSKIYCLFISYF